MTETKSTDKDLIEFKPTTNRNIFITIAIVVIGLALLGWYLFHPAHPKPVVKNDTAYADSIAKADSAAKAALALKQKPVAPVGKKYYVVAGCFIVESNADNFVTRLKGEGYNSEKFGTFLRYHVVSFASFDDKAAALKEMNRLRDAGKTDTWVLGY